MGRKKRTRAAEEDEREGQGVQGSEASTATEKSLYEVIEIDLRPPPPQLSSRFFVYSRIRAMIAFLSSMIIR